MTPIELHPEVLLDGALHAELDAEERKVLGAHVSECPACAMHLGAHQLFRHELGEGDEDPALNLAAADRAIAAVRAAQDHLLLRRGRARWSTRVMLAALVLGGIAVGAYFAPRHRPSVTVIDQPAGIPLPADSGSRTGPNGAATAVPAAEVGRTASGPEAAAPERSSTPAQTVSRVRPGAKPVPSDSAEVLFARANQLRRDRRDSEAMTLYRQLQRAFPDSREAKLSQATLATLLLEHGQATEALSGFDSYLRSGDTGAMTEDALVGRARALMKLDRRDQERATWQELLARFPNSIHTSRARTRLGELR
jgi:TolA-binding protein